MQLSCVRQCEVARINIIKSNEIKRKEKEKKILMMLDNLYILEKNKIDLCMCVCHPSPAIYKDYILEPALYP